MLKTGLDVLLQDNSSYFGGKKIGLLSNQASVNSELIHGRILLKKKFKEQFCCLFSPQHGFFSEKQDNMVESDHLIDSVTGLPVYSLYGEHRKPTPEMFAELDILLIDLVDVGTRVYTFLYTMVYCMEQAAESGKKIVVLDRPNPIGGERIEGNILRPDCQSFVGLFALPMRHGLTFGELALWINREYEIGADVEVIPLQGWKRSMLFRDTLYPRLHPLPICLRLKRLWSILGRYSGRERIFQREEGRRFLLSLLERRIGTTKKSWSNSNLWNCPAAFCGL